MALWSYDDEALPMSAPQPAPSPRALDLKRRLLLRVTLFAFGLMVVAATYTLVQAASRIRTNIQHTGSAIQRLITTEVARSSVPFDRELVGVETSLSGLAGIGEVVHFCAQVVDIYLNPAAARCFGGPGDADVLGNAAGAVSATGDGAPLARLLHALAGAEAQYRGPIGTLPGGKLGELTVTPNFASEAAQVGARLSALVALTAAILLINLLIYQPTRRALAPVGEIVRTLARMEAGDFAVRMPAFELVELTRIGQGFNHLANRLQILLAEHKQLAQRLLEVREEERRHLARELHDEFGQCLASIQLEAACARELALEHPAVRPALMPCAEAIACTTARMIEVLQHLLRRLRPVGLDEFGLATSLEQLVANWRRRGRGIYTLEIDGDCTGLPDQLQVSIYRIAQESLTNAAKHGHASRVLVRLQSDPLGGIVLTVDDNGTDNGKVRPAGAAFAGGLGLLGMSERVQALDGQLTIGPRQGGGVRLQVRLPWPGAAGVAAGAEAAA